jgi:oligopeptide/dipeptide ABC transporter ATP-binding protein
VNELLELRDVTVRFPIEPALSARLRGRRPLAVVALDRVSLTLGRGESVGIVGESGCGKSTLARTLVGLVEPTSGSIHLDGAEVDTRRSRAARRRVQLVFQDPSSSLNPARTVEQTLSELLRVHQMVPKSDVGSRCEELLDLVHLPRSALGALPRQLSGGQRQRVGIARALALEPDVLIADESVAALDTSVQASILNLLGDLRAQLRLTLVCISHDLAVVRHISDRLAVMYLGRIVETGGVGTIYDDPRHPYTRALIAAAPRMGHRKVLGQAALPGEPPSIEAIPSGCRFNPRCPLVREICRESEPPLLGSTGHRAACHFAWPSPGSNDVVAGSAAER